jgi:hypothetical protein
MLTTSFMRAARANAWCADDDPWPFVELTLCLGCPAHTTTQATTTTNTTTPTTTNTTTYQPRVSEPNRGVTCPRWATWGGSVPAVDWLLNSMDIEMRSVFLS